MLAGNLVVWYAVTVGVYLAAMGIGALLYDRWLQGSRWRSLFQVEIALTVVGALAVPVVHFAHAVHLFLYFNDFDISGSVLFFTVCFLTIFVVGLLTGLELPLLIRLGNDLSPARRVTNRVLGFDYLGALAGGLLFPLVLLPYQELLTIGLVTANANLCVAAFVLYRSSPAAPRRQPVDGLALRAGICAARTGVLVVSYANVSNLQQYFLKKYYYYDVAADSLGHLLKSMPDMPDVFRASPYQKIDIVQASSGDKTLIDAYSTKHIEDPSQPRDQFLFLNGDFQVGSNYEEVYHEFFAHVPVLLHGTVPDRVLVMGGGDGLLIRELLKLHRAGRDQPRRPRPGADLAGQDSPDSDRDEWPRAQGSPGAHGHRRRLPTHPESSRALRRDLPRLSVCDGLQPVQAIQSRVLSFRARAPDRGRLCGVRRAQ